MAQQVVVLAVKPRLPAHRDPLPALASALPADRAARAPQLAVSPSPTEAAAAELEPVPAILAVAPAAPEPAFVVPPALPHAATAAILPPRKVDIAQVAEAAPQSLHIPQLREPGLVAGAPPTLSASVDAMQVPLPPPPQLAGAERAAVLAETPSEMTVRIGDEAIGKVAFRTTETGMIDVQLSGLLDLVADRMAAEEYTRLRHSAAANSFVPLDQLRAIGLSLRYDAVYDELEISA